jgi:hypothetical protein
MGFRRRPDRLVLAATTVVFASFISLPSVRASVVGGASGLVELDPKSLAAAGASLLLAQAAAALAWQVSLRACGSPVSLRETFGCYGAGSLANSLLPGGVGDALRIELFSRAAGPGTRWLCGGVYAGISAGRVIVLSVLLSSGVAEGLLPWSFLAVPLFGVAVIGCATTVARQSAGLRRGQFACGASTLTLTSAFWLSIALALRLGAAIDLLHTLSVTKPVAAGIVLLATLGAAGVVTLTPGNVGIASAAIAVALTHAGVAPVQAAAVGIAYHALETAAGLVFGALAFSLHPPVANAFRPGPARARFLSRPAG